MQQAQQTAAFWTLAYWKHYFRVDADDVLYLTQVAARVLSTLNPVPTSSFNEIIGENPDLYGPFWIPTTTVFILFAASIIGQSIKESWAGTGKGSKLDIALLSFAAVAIYTFVFAGPAIIFAIAKYHGIHSVHLFHLLNVYGYGIFVWIPTAVRKFYLVFMHYTF